jgi:hypothetical protein
MAFNLPRKVSPRNSLPELYRKQITSRNLELGLGITLRALYALACWNMLGTDSSHKWHSDAHSVHRRELHRAAAAKIARKEPKLPLLRQEGLANVLHTRISRFGRNSRAGVGRKPGEQRFCFNATRANGTAFSDRTGPFSPSKTQKIGLFSELQLNATGFI